MHTATLAAGQQATPASEQWISLQEATRIFPMSISTINRNRRSGQLPYTRLGRKILINKQVMIDFLNRLQEVG